MTPLEARIDGEIHDFGRLKQKVWEFSSSRLLYSLGKGEIPDWLMENGRDHDILKTIYLGVKSPLNLEESSWVENLKKAYDKIESFDKKAYSSMNEDEKGKYALRFGKEFAVILKPLVDHDPVDYFMISNSLSLPSSYSIWKSDKE